MLPFAVATDIARTALGWLNDPDARLAETVYFLSEPQPVSPIRRREFFYSQTLRKFILIYPDQVVILHRLKNIYLSNESVEKKYDQLVAGGLWPSMVEEMTGQVLAFSPEALTKFNQATSRTELLEDMWKLKPYLTEQVELLEEYPDGTAALMERLSQLGLPQHLIDRHLVYPSGRPRTHLGSMTTIQSVTQLPASVYSSTDPVMLGKEYFNLTGHISTAACFPVVRYGAGMSRGAFFDVVTESEDAPLGTFYYYEPNSDIYLVSKSTLVAPNKITALVNMIGTTATRELIEEINQHRVSHSQEPFTPQRISPDLTNWDMALTALTSKEFNYLLHRPNFYATKDMFDQYVCHYAAQLNYDVVVLVSMTGKTRQVTELVDVRARADSYAALVRLG